MSREIVDWAAHLVFSPTVWLGFGLAGLAAVLYVVSGFMKDRQRPGPSRAAKNPATGPAALPAPGGKRRDPVFDDDPELAEIEALLRKRGIS